MSILDQIGQDTAAPQQADTDSLEHISQLAKLQIKVLGKTKSGVLKQGPSGSIISDLLSWGKKQECLLPEKGIISDWDCKPSDLSISELIALLRSKYAEYRDLSEIKIPLALSAVGMKSFTLSDGTGIEVKDDVMVSGNWKSDEGVPRAVLDFLESIQCADVVKDEIKVNLGKGEVEKAQQLLELAEALQVPATEKLSINAATLKALVKEQREKGVVFPEEYFKIFDFQKTIIK